MPRQRQARDVLLYIPNLIGYTRVALTIISTVMLILDSNYNKSPAYSNVTLIALVLYFISFAGDLVDGMLARKYDQCSQFGGVLDMVTDRCSTLGLLFVLAIRATSQYNAILYLFLAWLDVSSHWMQTHSSLLGKAHHKSAEGNKGRHFLVQWFYKYYWFFGYLCVGAELTYIFILALDSTRNKDSNRFIVLLHRLITLLFYIAAPGCFLKQCVNVSQLLSACRVIAEMDAQEYNDKNDKTKDR